jgi:hypothetical protein
MSDLTYGEARGEAVIECKHVCSMGCGNEYEFVVVTASDSTTQFLCVPCFVNAAMVIVAAITEPDNPDVMSAVEAYGAVEQNTVGRRGRKKALIGGVDSAENAGALDDFEPDIAEL